MRSPLEIRHLRLLQTLADTGTLSRTAQHIHVTQSALSQQIKQLEDHYGTSLFERKSNPIRFTPAGEHLLNLARQVLPTIDSAERDISRIAAGSVGRLRIAIECHSCFDWLMPTMDKFRDQWPEVEQDLVSGLTPDPVALLLTDEADLAVHTEPDQREGIRYHPLFDFEMVGCCSPKHALAGRAFLKPEDFAEETLIHYPVDDNMLDGIRHFLRPAGITSRARRTAELTLAIVQLTASGRGLSMLPAWSVQREADQGYIKTLPLGKDGLWCRLYAATREDAEPWQENFLELVRTLAPISLPGIRPCN
jgi:LysR family transcriptional regulator for metE and metH